MPDIVIIPTYDRPEMLWLCLEYLSHCPDLQRLQIRVCVDAHIGTPSYKEEILQVTEKFPQLSMQVWARQAHSFSGNSYNVLMSYKEAFQSAAEFVFLVEDDVIVRPDFFTWHRQWQRKHRIACSIGVTKKPHYGPYVSLGVCFRREMLAKLMVHCQTSYFQNMSQYCKTKFKPYPFDCEQDGLIARVYAGLPVAWTETPLAQHVGWYGYHRPKSIRPVGTLQERYDQVKHALSNEEILKGWVKEFHDIEPIRGV